MYFQNCVLVIIIGTAVHVQMYCKYLENCKHRMDFLTPEMVWCDNFYLLPCTLTAYCLKGVKGIYAPFSDQMEIIMTHRNDFHGNKME